MFFETECEMAIHSHSQSLISIKSVPIESAYESSIVTLVVSCPVSELLQVFCWEERPHPIPPEFWGCSPWTRLPMLWFPGPKTLSYLLVQLLST